MQITVILNNIRSNENVGSVFRTGDASGINNILLCGYTPSPLDRFNRPNPGLIKASLGAEKTISWQKFENLESAISSLKIEGYKVVAIEQSKKSIDYKKIKEHLKSDENSKLALVFGNEVDGLSEEDISFCDAVAEIKMRGEKESLNVSVCAGVVLFSLVE
jgi:tRNA G18 (ribose-2'-O)-methylase SpoU